jgi:hypothetical protein
MENGKWKMENEYGKWKWNSQMNHCPIEPSLCRALALLDSASLVLA